jgi:NDP-sugar pyrophosphorylase family protein
MVPTPVTNKGLSMSIKKYVFTDETQVYEMRTLRRIKAITDFGSIKSDQLGGWLESENNLSHEGECWVYNDAKVYDNARVYDNAKIFNNAEISGVAQVYENATVSDNAKISKCAQVYGNAKVRDNVHAMDVVKIYGDALVFGSAWVYCFAQIYGKAVVTNNINFDCDVNFGNAVCRLLTHKDRSRLIGMDPDIDKILGYLHTKIDPVP